jgi:transaldolase
VGATTNPTIVAAVLKEEMPVWGPRIRELIAQNPDWCEAQISWQIIEEMAVKGAKLLFPVFQKENGRKGRISIQTNPVNYRNAKLLAEQAIHFNTLAPNIQVKIPVTAAGVKAIEEAAYNGVNINATVCFTVPQAIAVAEALERAMNRREKEGKPVDNMFHVCTIMIGRTDDWIKVVANKEGITVTPGDMDWAGIACFKKAYGIYQQRKYRTRLLAAAYRHHMHWSELIGGDVVLTIPYPWQVLFNNSDIEVKERMHNPVAPAIVDSLYQLLLNSQSLRRRRPKVEILNLWRHRTHTARIYRSYMSCRVSSAISCYPTRRKEGIICSQASMSDPAAHSAREKLITGRRKKWTDGCSGWLETYKNAEKIAPLAVDEPAWACTNIKC